MFKKIITAATLAGGLLVPAIAAASTPAVVTTDLNIRTGPGTAYQRFAVIPGGDRVTVHGCLSGYNWCDVGWAGERGWVSGNYLAYRGARYERRPIPSIAVTIGVPTLRFEPYAYHNRHYQGRSWYSDRYLDRRDVWQDRREDRQEWRRGEREDRRDWRGDDRRGERGGNRVEIRQDNRDRR